MLKKRALMPSAVSFQQGLSAGIATFVSGVELKRIGYLMLFVIANSNDMITYPDDVA
jgi:hypothetical protein